MDSRRLKDRIDALCAKAICTPEGPELAAVIKELQTTLREHTEQLRKMATEIPHADRRKSGPS